MSLTLHYHPLSSFCMKALIGLYELELPFEKQLVDLSDPAQRAALMKLWPIGKFPVLRDDVADRTVPESTIILEHLDLHYGRGRLVPSDPDGTGVTVHGVPGAPPEETDAKKFKMIVPMLPDERQEAEEAGRAARKIRKG